MYFRIIRNHCFLWMQASLPSHREQVVGVCCGVANYLSTSCDNLSKYPYWNFLPLCRMFILSRPVFHIVYLKVLQLQNTNWSLWKWRKGLQMNLRISVNPKYQFQSTNRMITQDWGEFWSFKTDLGVSNYDNSLWNFFFMCMSILSLSSDTPEDGREPPCGC